MNQSILSRRSFDVVTMLHKLNKLNVRLSILHFVEKRMEKENYYGGYFSLILLVLGLTLTDELFSNLKSVIFLPKM